MKGAFSKKLRSALTEKRSRSSRRHHQQMLLPAQGDGLELLRHAAERADHQVDPVVGDGLLHHVGRLLAQLEEGVGVFAQEGGQDPRQDRTGDGMLNAQMDVVRARKTAARALLELLLELQDLLGDRQQMSAVRRQGERAAADEQRRAEILLELGDLLGQRLLGDEKVLGRGGEAFLLGHCDKAF